MNSSTLNTQLLHRYGIEINSYIIVLQYVYLAHMKNLNAKTNAPLHNYLIAVRKHSAVALTTAH